MHVYAIITHKSMHLKYIYFKNAKRNGIKHSEAILIKQ